MPEFTLESAVKFLVDPKSVQQVNNTVRGIKSMIGKALGAIGIGFSLKALNDAVEQVRSVNLALESAVGQFGDMDEIQKKILETSKDVVGNYEDIAKNVGDLVKNNKTLFDLDNATRFTEIMTKLTKLSGGSNSDAAGLVSSMASAMKNGKFDGGSLESLFAKAPQAIKILTDYYGVSERKLRTMAQAGILKAKDIQKAFMDAGESVDKAFSEMGPRISDVMSSARSQLKYFIEETDEMFGITREIAKFLQSGFQTVMSWLQKARSGVVFLNQKLGGMQNTLKLLAIIAASFAVAMNFDKIVQGVKSLTGVFSGLGLKGMAIVAIIALILLGIEDFIGFMQGKDSLLGRIFDKAGINADEVRETITEAWKKVKELFSSGAVWLKQWWNQNGSSIVGRIKEITEEVGKFIGKFSGSAWTIISKTATAVKRFFDGFKESPALDTLKELINTLGDLFDTIVEVSSNVVEKVGDAIGKFLDHFVTFELGEAFGRFVSSFSRLVTAIGKVSKTVIQDIGEAIGIILDKANIEGEGTALSKLVENLLTLGSMSLESIAKGLERAGDAISGFAQKIAEGWVENVDPYFEPIIEDISDLIEKFTELSDEINEKIAPLQEVLDKVFGEAFQTAIEQLMIILGGFTQLLSGVVSTLISDLEFLIDLLRGDFPAALEDAKKGWDGLFDIGGGLKKMFVDSMAPGVEKTKEWVSESGLVQGIKDFLTPGNKEADSEKDSIVGGWIKSLFRSKGNAEQSEADKQGFMDWIKSNAGDLFGSVGEGLSAITGVTIVHTDTASSISDRSNTNKSVVQNVNIENTFNGDTAGQKKSHEAMSRAAKDVTAEMGRALQFAR